MKRHDAQSLGDVLKQALNESSMDARIAELKAIDVWKDVTGSYISSHTKKISVKNGILTVGIPDASLRNELSMMRNHIVRMLNERTGRQTILDIRFISA